MYEGAEISRGVYKGKAAREDENMRLVNANE